MAATDGVPVRCQRIGCDTMFTEQDNVDGSCRYHDSGPIFHDGMKEWSCCKQKSHDFSLFLAIPGCKTGKHTTEKPATKIVSTNTRKPAPVQSSTQKKSEESCSRCRQGFFCSDHGSQGRPSKAAVVPGDTDNQVENSPAPVKKKIGINEPQTCRNKGCGKTFKEKENHETACEYHPGPAVFHDRLRGWKCCDVHVKEFDEFLSIPPCAKGWHNADAA
ncbi:cysteine and histidine-rich domain-containing protein RAR1 [Zingiber officinale]|uniref:cysteine and histidine-rich domain-containing protein RAR1 n=1 Tax=Zingiber officinale TaxID=94328 RepID=UPI001C4BBED7|nr:cysteine and histidine-rich domain-containing protein RAR1 [Zingiber officinale]XP_042457367.1 cysteine and histidine-rich domain-containing protein RAR1 [Zingiber officinale]